MPASCAPDALDAALRFAAPGTRIFGGMLPPAPDAAQLRLYDYAKDEALLLENAALTADAAAQLLQQRLPRSLSASRVLLCGFGRIGKLLARSLVCAGAAVTVSVRRPADFALCRILGLPCVKTGVFAPADGFDAIVNTVPAQILPDSYVSAAAPGCVLLELASSPGGFGSQAQKRPGYVCARGLPGRYAPHAAAACIHDAILRTLSPEERL